MKKKLNHYSRIIWDILGIVKDYLLIIRLNKVKKFFKIEHS